MPAFTFKGFLLGTTVQIAVDQGGNSASESVSTWGQSNLASIEILTVSTAAPVSPAGVWLEAQNLSGFNVGDGPAAGEHYDPSAHEITYVWTVRGQPLANYASPENMVAGWNNPNVAYGKKVAFVFPDPGSYTIDLWAIDSEGNIAVAEETITVADADTLYPGDLTICFSNDPGETWAGEKPGCRRATSESELQGMLQATAPTPARILFKRGQTATNVDLFLDWAQLGYVGDWGTGAKPILEETGDNYLFNFWDGASSPEFTCHNIDFRGRWDSTTETGRPTRTPFFFLIQSTACHWLFHNNSFDGFTDLSMSVRATLPSTVIFADNAVTNWRDYGIFCDSSDNPASRMAIIGSKLAQHPDAMNGGDKNGLFNTHGAIRYAGTYNVYIAGCDLFSRCGWSGLGTDTAEQPCLRVNSLGYADRYLNVERCVMEGGWRVVSLSGQNGGPGGTVENPGNYILDKVLMIAGAKTLGPFSIPQFGGTTFRNVIGIVPNTPQWHVGGNWPSVFSFVPDNPAGDNGQAPVAVHSSSFVCLIDSANDQSITWSLDDGSTAFASKTLENNVSHAADLNVPVTGDGPLDLTTTISGVSARYKGVRFNFASQSGGFGGNIGPGQSFTIPYAAITDALVRQNPGTPTNQAYWQAIAGIDTRHLLVTRNDSGNAVIFAAEDGELSVSFEASVVRVTNTSALTWYTDYSLRLDRKSLIPPMQTAYASPAALPLPRPQAGSGALNTGDLGLRAYDDFLGNVRPGPSQTGLDHLGNPRPTVGNEQGALLES